MTELSGGRRGLAVRRVCAFLLISVAALAVHAGAAQADAVHAVSVSVSPPSSAVGARTSYTVSFTTSGAGGLSGSANSQISIVFPSGTGLGSLSSSSMVTDTSSGDQVGSGCTVSGTTVTCSVFGMVRPGDRVSVELDDVVNPSSPGPQTAQVSTSSDTTPGTSSSYTITPAGQTTQPTVSTQSSAAGAHTVYTVLFGTSSTGGLSGPAGSQITVTLPSGTGLGAASGIVTDAAGGQQVGSCSPSGTTMTCSIFATVAAQDQLTVELDDVVNPSTPSTTETLRVSTSSDTIAAASANYSITTAGQPSQPAVNNASPSSAAAARTIYTIAFTTSATGGLSGTAQSLITILFPAGTGLGSLSGSTVTDSTNGQQVSSNCQVSGTTVTCPISGSVSAGDQVSIEIDGVVNPSTPGSQTLRVSTTSDTSAATSAGYTVTSASQVSQPTVSTGTSASGAHTVYAVAFRTSATGGLSSSASSTITLVLPTGTGLGSLTAANVTDTTSGQQVGSCSSSGTTETCSISGTVNGGDQIVVELDGVVNPTATGSETARLSTTSDTGSVTSSSYSITAATQASQPMVTDNSPSSAAGARTVYMIAFTTSATGSLSGSSGSQITINFPSGTGIASASGSVTDVANGQPVSSGCNAAGTTLTCNISGNVPGGDPVDVEVDGVVNPSTPGPQTLRLATSSDTSSVTSASYSVTSAGQVGQPTVTNRPPAAGVGAVYTVSFVTSGGGALAGSAGSQISIVFPTGTGLGSLSNSLVTDSSSGQLVGSGCTPSGTTVTCQIFGTVSAGDQVAVELDGVVNPPSPGSQTLRVSTTSDTTPATSTSYTITTANQPTQPAVSTDSSAAGAHTVYRVTFGTSSTGGLSGSAGSQITITFPSGTGLGSASGAATDTSNGQQVGSCGPSGTTMTCSVFATVAPQDQISVEVDGIVNPSTPATETLRVSTSSDTSPATSSSYTITPASQASRPTVNNASPSSAAGARTVYTITFATSDTGALSVPAQSQIAIIFPPGTGLGSISGSVSDNTNGQQVSTNCQAAGATVTCPISGAVAADDQVSVEIDGVVNPSTPGTQTLRLSTTSDTKPSTSAPYTVGAAIVVTGPATNIAQNTASLTGTVNPEQTAVSDCHFDWGTSPSYGNTVPCAQVVGSGNTAVPVSAGLTGLSPNTTYHFRIAATNAGGTSDGADEIFTTPVSLQSVSAPAVFPDPPVPDGATGASFSGSVDPAGLATTAHFEYGLDPKYSGGGQVVYGQVTPNVQAGSDFAGHSVSASVSALVPNALYHVRLVASNGAGTTLGPDQTFTTGQLPPPPPPTVGQTANLTPVDGLVLVKPPSESNATPSVRAAGAKGAGFIPLTQIRQLPVGSLIDARKGRLTLAVASGLRRGTQSAHLTGGLFRVSQQRSGPQKGLTTFTLEEGLFPGAPTYAVCKSETRSAGGTGVAAKVSSRVLQLLHAKDSHGRFRTVGRYSAATVRGTEWETADRCDGTLTRVLSGTVDVLDLVLSKTFAVHAGGSYLASPSSHRASAKKHKKKKTQ